MDHLEMPPVSKRLEPDWVSIEETVLKQYHCVEAFPADAFEKTFFDSVADEETGLIVFRALFQGHIKAVPCALLIVSVHPSAVDEQGNVTGRRFEMSEYFSLDPAEAGLILKEM